MNLANIGKFVVVLVTSSAVTQVVGNIVSATTPVQISNVNKVLTKVGGYVLSGMISDKASGYVIEELDNLLKNLKPEKNEIDEEE